MSRLSFEEKSIISIKKRAEIIDNVSAEDFDGHLWLFGSNVAFDIYYTFFDYNTYTYEGDRVGSITTQPARLNAWTATVMNYLTELERRGGHRRKMYADTYTSY